MCVCVSVYACMCVIVCACVRVSGRFLSASICSAPSCGATVESLRSTCMIVRQGLGFNV